jgi:hypothetical protein
MADEKMKRGKSDLDRIDISKAYELQDWSTRFGITPEHLMAAVRAVGPIAADVARHLGKKV